MRRKVLLFIAPVMASLALVMASALPAQASFTFRDANGGIGGTWNCTGSTICDVSGKSATGYLSIPGPTSYTVPANTLLIAALVTSASASTNCPWNFTALDSTAVTGSTYSIQLDFCYKISDGTDKGQDSVNFAITPADWYETEIWVITNANTTTPFGSHIVSASTGDSTQIDIPQISTTTTSSMVLDVVAHANCSVAQTCLKTFADNVSCSHKVTTRNITGYDGGTGRQLLSQYSNPYNLFNSYALQDGPQNPIPTYISGVTACTGTHPFIGGLFSGPSVGESIVVNAA